MTDKRYVRSPKRPTAEGIQRLENEIAAKLEENRKERRDSIERNQQC